MPVLVYVAGNEVLAQILMDVLIQHGIVDVRICRHGWNDPVTDASWIGDEGWGLPKCEVWIGDERDLDRAEAIVRDFEQGAGEPAGPTWRCPKCGEEIEVQFTECWKCGTGPKR